MTCVLQGIQLRVCSSSGNPEATVYGRLILRFETGDGIEAFLEGFNTLELSLLYDSRRLDT